MESLKTGFLNGMEPNGIGGEGLLTQIFKKDSLIIGNCKTF